MIYKLRAFIAGTLLIINTLFWCGVLFVLTPLKLIMPEYLARKIMDPVFSWIATMWIYGNSGWMNLTQNTEWDVELSDNLDPKGWYFVSSNHLSAVDIFALQHLLNGKIPFLKFFLKQELIRTPVIGQAWWALDFPFMKRYSKAYLEKHPEMKGKDIETTQKACQKFRYTPTSVMNFLEGTRLTPSRHAKQQSPYRHLLKPKSGGFAFALSAMGDRFQSLLDFTIIYPDGIPSSRDFMEGRVKKIVVRMKEIPIPAEFSQGDYENDPVFRETFQNWISGIWQEKDDYMESLHKELGLTPVLSQQEAA